MKSIYDREYIVKITEWNGTRVLQTVYYRYRLPYRLLMKYEWYFEYITALCKMKRPKSKFRLQTFEWDGTILCGDDYVKASLPNKLKGRYNVLHKLQKEVVTMDLFGFSERAQNDKIEKVQKEIERLENGYFDYPIFETYINKIKEL